jgi:serine/threonine protein kinase
MTETLPFSKRDFIKTNPSGIKSNSNIRGGLYEIKESFARPITAAEAVLLRPPKARKRSERSEKTREGLQRRDPLKIAILSSRDALNRLPTQNISARKNTTSPMSRPLPLHPNLAKVPRAVSMPRKAEEDCFAQSLSNFLIIKILGKGAYATVRLAQNVKNNVKVAIKTYDKYHFIDPVKKANLHREIEILKKLDHPNIVKLLETVDGKKHFHLVLEFVKGQSLYNYIKTRPAGILEEMEAKRLFRQIASAFEYCHSQSVAHRDIKLDNILLDKKQNVKIIDFGFSTFNSHDEKSRIFCGTPSYMAPEIVGRKDYYGVNADVWALGILLYAMVCGKMPFKAHNDKELYRRIERGSFTISGNFSESLKSLIFKMLEVNPKKRISIKAVLDDEWVSGSGIVRSTTLILPVRKSESGSLDLEIISGIVKFT